MPQSSDGSDNLLYFNGGNVTSFFKEFKELCGYNKVLVSEDRVRRSIRFMVKAEKERYKELSEYNTIEQIKFKEKVLNKYKDRDET